MWRKHWPELTYICQWPIFHGPMILPYILKTICWTNAIIGILVPCDAKIYLIKCMWVSDLHFMVQLFCLIAWRLFDGLMLYRRYWFSVTQTLNWNYRWFHVMKRFTSLNVCGSVTCISRSSDFALYLEDYLMENVIVGILDPRDAKINHIKCMWVSDLHFVVQWFWHILKTFWWRNVGLEIQCDIQFDLHMYM